MKLLSEDKLAIVEKLITTFKMRPMLCNSDKSPKSKWSEATPLTAQEVVSLSESGAFIGYRIGAGTILLDLDNDTMSSTDKYTKLCEEYPAARTALLHMTPNGKHLIFRTESNIGQTQGTMCKLGFKIDTRVPASETNQGGYAVMYPSENGKRAFLGEEINTINDINELPLYPSDLLAPTKESSAVVTKSKQTAKAIKPSNEGHKCSVIEYIMANPESLSPLEAGKGNGHRFIFQLLSMLFQYPALDRKAKYAELVSALTTAKVDTVHICSLDNLEETGKTPSCGSMVEYCKLAGVESFDLCRNCSVRKAHLKEVKSGEININFNAIKTYAEFKTFINNYYYNAAVEKPNSIVRAEIKRRMIMQYGFKNNSGLMFMETNLPQLKKIMDFDKSYIKRIICEDFPNIATVTATSAITDEICSSIYDADIMLKVTDKINKQQAILMSNNKVLDAQMRIRDLAQDDIFINKLNSCYDTETSISDEHKAILDKAIADYDTEYIYNIMGMIMWSIIPGQDKQVFHALIGSRIDKYGMEHNAGFGKTAFMALIMSLIGNDNVKTPKIEEFAKRFVDPKLSYAMLIYIDEVNDREQAHEAMNAMKDYVNNGNKIQIEAKGQQSRSTYINNAAITLSTNSPGSFLNKSDQGSLRRFRPCIFTRQFSNIEDLTERNALSDNYMTARNILASNQGARNYLFTKIVNFIRECLNNNVDIVPALYLSKKEELSTSKRDEVNFAVFDEYLQFDYAITGKDRLTAAQIMVKLKQYGVKSLPDSSVYFGKALAKYVDMNNGSDFVNTYNKQNVYRCEVLVDSMSGRIRKAVKNIHTAVEIIEEYKKNHNGEIVSFNQIGNNLFQASQDAADAFNSVFGATNEPDYKKLL